MRIVTAIATLTLLGACETADLAEAERAMAWSNLIAETDRDIEEAYRDLPFDTGMINIVANEHGDLHTYSLIPCRNGTHICGGTGRVGHVQRTPDHFVVTGAYRDRTFYLSPGGDGYLTWRGANRDLAWN